MKLHPLTPRQPVALATTLQLFVTLTATLTIFAAMMTVFPPVAWIGHLDEPRDADTIFFITLLTEYLGAVVERGDPIGSLIRLIDVPSGLASLLSAFGVGTQAGVRALAALFVGTLIGLETRQALLADVLAQPLVSHVKGPRLVAGRAARRSLSAAWAKRFGVASPGWL